MDSKTKLKQEFKAKLFKDKRRYTKDGFNGKSDLASIMKKIGLKIGEDTGIILNKLIVKRDQPSVKRSHNKKA